MGGRDEQGERGKKSDRLHLIDDVFLDRLETKLNDVYPSATVLRLAKPTFTKPAPAEFLDEVSATCDVAVEALAD